MLDIKNAELREQISASQVVVNNLESELQRQVAINNNQFRVEYVEGDQDNTILSIKRSNYAFKARLVTDRTLPTGQCTICLERRNIIRNCCSIRLCATCYFKMGNFTRNGVILQVRCDMCHNRLNIDRNENFAIRGRNEEQQRARNEQQRARDEEQRARYEEQQRVRNEEQQRILDFQIVMDHIQAGYNTFDELAAVLVLHFNRNNLERVLHQMENEHNIITRRNGLLELAGRDDDRIIEQQNQFEIDAVKEAIEHGNTTVAAMKEYLNGRLCEIQILNALELMKQRGMVIERRRRFRLA